MRSMGFPDGSDGKILAYNAGNLGSIPGSGRSPEEGNGYPLLYSYVENPMGGGAWWAALPGETTSKARNTWSHQKLTKRHGRHSLSQPSERINSANLVFKLLDCRTVRQCLLSPKVKLPWFFASIICPNPFYPLRAQFHRVFYNPLIWINFSIPNTSRKSCFPIITTAHDPVL